MIDNIYTLNYLVERELASGKRIVATFVDLRTAFDSVDRGGFGKEEESKMVVEGKGDRESEGSELPGLQV